MISNASLIMVNIDGDDPAGLAAFYHTLLGWEVTASTDEYAMVSDGSSSLGFGRIADYRAPSWPDDGKQFHLDLYVDDVADAARQSLEAGATRPDFQPGGDKWTVLLDPAGHPFCLCPRP